MERNFNISKLNTEEDYYLFANRMRYLGIDNLLREAGVKDGDTVRIENFEFEFVE
ncbi:Obg family GTPase CgtA [Faecalibaculum rodentium]|uniref:Obg family GTPase CgtA n=1 Tax=Faecalibaculum rodentium TaxID=1702221 RepID=UPI0026197CE5|nr:Obg family GTPase CgtA [Faecalibaculum rodentium]